MMSISEAQRFTMHTELRKVLGEEVADTMMEYMPPIGWSDVARKSDIDRLEQRLNHVDQRFEQIDQRFEQIDKRFDQIDKRFDQVDKRFAGLVGGLWALGAITAAGFFGLGTAIITKL